MDYSESKRSLQGIKRLAEKAGVSPLIILEKMLQKGIEINPYVEERIRSASVLQLQDEEFIEFLDL